MNIEKKLRFGILGCSRIAKKSAIPAIIDSDTAVLGMIGSRSKDDARVCAETFGCQSYGTYEEVLANPDIDAVYISLPNSLHEEWVLKAAAAGKHVWCEKPAAITYDSAKRMVAACKENNVRLMEGFMFLSHPQQAKVRELIAAGTLGELLTFEGCLSFPMPDPGSNLLDANLGGGIFNDSASYCIRASRMVFAEEPLSVTCVLTIDEESRVDVKADMLITYPGGRSALLTAVFDGYYRSTYSILGTDAYLSMERAYAVSKDRNVKIFLSQDDATNEIAIAPADHFKLMIEEFCSEIALGDSSTKDYEQDLLSQARILEASRISHLEKRIIYLSEIS